MLSIIQTNSLINYKKDESDENTIQLVERISLRDHNILDPEVLGMDG